MSGIEMRQQNNQLDVSAHANGQNSLYELKAQSPSPTMQNERECIGEVTDTGFGVADEAVTSRTQSAEVYFYMKSKFRTNRIAPLFYLGAQLLILSPIVIGHFTTSSSDHNGELFFLLLCTGMAMAYYLRAAWTNPGYLQGSAADEAKKAGAYDPKNYSCGPNNNLTIDISVANHGGYSEDNNDLSIIDQNFDDISPTGATGKHDRNASFLTKDFNISRHERQKSAMNGTEGTQPDMCTYESNGNDVLTAPNRGETPLSVLGGNDHAILKNNLSVNDNKHRRRIKSVLPGDYVSNNSATSASASLDPELGGSMASRGGTGSDARNAAYEAIQAKIKAAAEANQKNKEDDEDPFQSTTPAQTTQATSNNAMTKANTNFVGTTDGSQTTMMMTVTSGDSMPALKMNSETKAETATLQTRVKHFSMDSASSEQPCVVNSEASEPDTGAITTTKAIKMDTINETGENDDDEVQESSEEEEELQMFVEMKYCTICHLEQPLRTKHCKSCDQCVATHDHHCPWIGNCVGERNKARFYYYLVVQLIQMITAISLGLKYLIENVEEHRREFSKLTILEFYIGLACFFTLCFTAFVVALLVFHTVLAGKNLTSWEFISWMRITYLKVWPRKYGSPFTEGSTVANLKQFFCYPFARRLQIYPWKMPKKFPKLQ